jgi:hypothetical protein
MQLVGEEGDGKCREREMTKAMQSRAEVRSKDRRDTKIMLCCAGCEVSPRRSSGVWSSALAARCWGWEDESETQSRNVDVLRGPTTGRAGQRSNQRRGRRKKQEGRVKGAVGDVMRTFEVLGKKCSGRDGRKRTAQWACKSIRTRLICRLTETESHRYSVRSELYGPASWLHRDSVRRIGDQQTKKIQS